MLWRVSAEEGSSQTILSLCKQIMGISANSPCRFDLQSADDPGMLLTFSDYSVAAALPCNRVITPYRDPLLAAAVLPVRDALWAEALSPLVTA